MKKESLFTTLLGCLVAIAGFMAHSVWELNQNVAVVIETLAWHQRAIERHEGEISTLKLRR